MRKYLSVILALVMVFGVITLAGCSKKATPQGGDDGGDTTAAEPASVAEVPDGYAQVTCDNEFFGLRYGVALPQYEKFEEDARRDGYKSFKGYVNAADYDCYTVRVIIDVTTEDGKKSAFEESSGTVETIALGGNEAAKHSGYTSMSGDEMEYDVFVPFMDGYANFNIEVSYLNDDLTAEQWTEVVNAVEKYSTFQILDTNKLTQNGKLVDSSGTMAFATPATIAGQSVELKQTLRMRNMLVEGEFTADSIPYRIIALGNTTDSVYNARKEKTDEYFEVTSGNYTFYAHMINRFPNVECDLYTEIDGVYYNFYIYRNHKYEVEANKEFVADTANFQIFADMTADMINAADINAANLVE